MSVIIAIITDYILIRMFDPSETLALCVSIIFAGGLAGLRRE